MEMDELSNMARAPLTLFDRFLEQARKTVEDKSLSQSLAAEKLKALQESLGRELEQQMRAFRSKAAEKEKELLTLLNPPQSDLAQKALQAVQELTKVIEQWARREQLKRKWAEQPAADLVADYERAFQHQDLDVLEFFEAEAEQVLRRRGDPQTIAAFEAIKIKAVELRLTPTQKEAKAQMQELERIKEEAKISMNLMATTLRAFAPLLPMSKYWRRHERYPLDLADQKIASLTVLANGQWSPATLLDFGEGGLRLQAPRKFDVGTVLELQLAFPGVAETEIVFRGEVRWCQEDPSGSGHFATGVRILGEGEPWSGFFLKMLDHFKEMRNLFSAFTS